MASGAELPTAVAERARRHRARLDSRGVRIEGGGRDGPDLTGIDESTSNVLLVAALPSDGRRMITVLQDLRHRLGPGSTVRIVQPTRPLMRTRAGRLADRVRGGPAVRSDRPDVVEAVRASGLTVAAIERFHVDEARTDELWVDLAAVDLGSAEPSPA